MRITNELSEAAVLDELGRRIAHHRIRLRMTQQDLGKASGLGARTISRVECGESVEFTTVMRMLRSMGLAENLEVLVPPVTATPLEILASQPSPRTRASRRRAGSQGLVPWGDDQ